MGFDPARIDCKPRMPLSCSLILADGQRKDSVLIERGIKGHQACWLASESLYLSTMLFLLFLQGSCHNVDGQPAMDHLIEHSDDPIPAADDPAAGGGDEEDDEEALALHIKKTGASGEDLVAKVSLPRHHMSFGARPMLCQADVQSIKCSECGKIFRSQATASFHAEKSGHTDFEESTEEVSFVTCLSRDGYQQVLHADRIDQTLDGRGEESEAG